MWKTPLVAARNEELLLDVKMEREQFGMFYNALPDQILKIKRASQPPPTGGRKVEWDVEYVSDSE